MGSTPHHSRPAVQDVNEAKWMREQDGRLSVRPTCRFDLSRPHRLEAHRKPLTGLLPFWFVAIRLAKSSEDHGVRPSTLLYRAPRPRVFGHGDRTKVRPCPVGLSDGHVARPCPGRDPRTPLVIPGRRQPGGVWPVRQTQRARPAWAWTPIRRLRESWVHSHCNDSRHQVSAASLNAGMPGRHVALPTRLPPGRPFGGVITDRAPTRR